MPGRSRGATEKAGDEGALGRHVVARHGAHLSLRQYRHGLDAGEGSPSGRPKGARNLRSLIAEEFKREVTAKEGAGRSSGRPCRS